MLVGRSNSLTISGNFPQLYIIISFAVILSLLTPGYIWAYIFSVLLVLPFLLFKEKFILFSVIVLLIVLVGEINPTLRLVIQIMAIVLLTFIVIRKYGFDFDQYSSVPPPILGFLASLYIVIVISTLHSDFSIEGITLILRLSAFFVFVYLFFVMIKNADDARLYISALIFSAMVIAAGTLYDFMQTGFNLLMIAGKIYRTGGFIGNYNATGGYFAIAIPLLIASLNISPTKKVRIVQNAMMSILFIALIISGSRSAFLACSVSVFMVLFIINRKLLIRICISLVIAILALFLFEPIRDFIIMALRVESGLTHREHLWKISTDLIKDNFIFGIGPGAYAFKMFDYFPAMLNSFQGRNLIGLYEATLGRNSAHNFFLIMFTDLGILGFIVSILLPFVFFRISRTVLSYLKKSDDHSYYLVVGIVSTMTGLFVRALFDGINIMSYGWISVDLPFWLMFSILIYFYNNIVIAKKQLLAV